MARKPMCPKYCGVALENVEVGKVVVDQCPKCEGVWFDLEDEELTECLRVGYEDAPPKLRRSWEAGGGRPSLGKPKGYNCPRCGAELSTYNYLSTLGTTFEIDGCPKGHVLWLDDGELGSAYETLKYSRARRGDAGRIGKPVKRGFFDRLWGFLSAR